MVVKHFQDGGRPPIWKSTYRHISVKNHRIFMTFCTQQQIWNWMNVTWSKMKKLHWTDSELDRTYFLWSKVKLSCFHRQILSLLKFFLSYFVSVRLQISRRRDTDRRESFRDCRSIMSPLLVAISLGVTICETKNGKGGSVFAIFGYLKSHLARISHRR